MLHALLHGKLDPAIAEPQRLEDALTSSVFGTLVLVQAWDLLAVWLGADPPTTVDGTQEVDCWFWPRLAGGVEPDVILRLGQTLIVVEAKYRSGRHDLSLDDPEDERPVDQIDRQHRAVSPPYERRSPYPELLERAVRDCRVVQAFVVDARRMRQARREHAESRKLLPEEAALNLVTWQALHKLLLDPRLSRLRWAADVTTYLTLSGLATFHGIRRDIPEAESLPAIGGWTPFGQRSGAIGLRAAATALAAEPALTNLDRWRTSHGVIGDQDP
jgi:hypothetical protein